jgi:hypothetical protein
MKNVALTKKFKIFILILLTILVISFITSYTIEDKIAFTSYRDGNRDVYIMNADGSGQVNLTNNPAAD